MSNYSHMSNINATPLAPTWPTPLVARFICTSARARTPLPRCTYRRGSWGGRATHRQWSTTARGTEARAGRCDVGPITVRDVGGSTPLTANHISSKSVVCRGQGPRLAGLYFTSEAIFLTSAPRIARPVELKRFW